MQMSDGERLIAIMLAEVMQELKIDRELDPKLVKTLVMDKDEWALRRVYPGIFDSEEPSDEVVKETGDILWMFSIIESSVGRLSGAAADEAKGWHYKQWRGFDGNNDPHYGVARTMIETLGEFSDSRKGVNLNSHTQSTLPRYRRMYEKFHAYVQASEASPLSVDALRDLCA
ncbi:YfbU family protein [Sphingomonas carotinifaciens]|uniref:YfbU family protein n=1 Tax=Sphingomonas carotinifaciens TaxID=1166323 RepID=UPI000DD8E45D|nr:YfbU family protein [Sphingomonas carotinifaciens]